MLPVLPTISHINSKKYPSKVKQHSTTFRGLSNGTMPDVVIINGSQTQAKVYTNNLDYKTYEQIKNICSHPVFKDAPVRIMPDTHAGKTAVVGFTVPVSTENGIIPGLISGDIGCGMLCVELDTKGKKIDFEKLDNVVRTYIADGHEKAPSVYPKLSKQIDRQVDDLCGKYKVSSSKSMKTLGTIGGGNHFIEIDKDGEDNTYLVIHTGSRTFGKNVYDYHQKVAVQQNPYYIKDLSFLTGNEAKEYLDDMEKAIKYSKINRRIIADEIMKQMDWKEKNSFESIHNYIGSDRVLRKGAIKSTENQQVIIPLNMRDGAIIGIGKSNEDWNNSAPHGAGRQFSRAEASELIDLDDYKKEMEGIYSSCISESTIDESPQAYKGADEIVKNINDTVEIKKIIKPIYNFKD